MVSFGAITTCFCLDGSSVGFVMRSYFELGMYNLTDGCLLEGGSIETSFPSEFGSIVIFPECLLTYTVELFP